MSGSLLGTGEAKAIYISPTPELDGRLGVEETSKSVDFNGKDMKHCQQAYTRVKVVSLQGH